jgi:hypothetical protein
MAAIAATKAIAMTRLQKAIVTATVTVLVGAGVYEARKASRLESELRIINEQHALLVAQIGELENQRGTQQQRTKAPADKKRSDEDSELLRLSGEVGLLRRQLADLATRAQTTMNQIQFTAPYLPRAAWSEQGSDTPDNTIRTMFWAIGQGDQNRLEQIVFPKASQSLDSLTFSKQDWDKIAAVQFVSVVRLHLPNGEDQANVNTLVERVLEGGTKDVSIQRWNLMKINDQWSIIAWY